MGTLLTIPHEIISVIYSWLSFKDILSVRNVCKGLQIAISTDEVLWARILTRDVLDRGIRLPPYLKPFGLADASAVESWTRNALMLEKAYKSPKPLPMDRLTTGTRSVTWTKLIRGRWCLFASSNVSESRISLWDISSPDRQVCAEVLLPGPVMDGQVDDRTSEINVAVSVGSREPFVQILCLGNDAGSIHIVKLRRISGAYHTLLLSGCFVGVAVTNEGDSNPSMIDWKTGTTWGMILPTVRCFSTSVASQARLICLGITIWKHSIIVVFSRGIQVYRQRVVGSSGGLCTDRSSGPLVIWDDRVVECRFLACDLFVTGSLYAQNRSELGDNGRPHDFGEDVVVDCDAARSEEHGVEGTPQTKTAAEDTAENTMLYIFLLSKNGGVSVYKLNEHGQIEGDRFRCRIPQQYPAEVLSIVPGCSGNMVVFLCATTHIFRAPIILLARVQRRKGPPDADVCLEYCALSGDNVPRPHFWPCLDFDDSRGVLLLGSQRGELSVSRFVNQGNLQLESVDDMLPPLRIVNNGSDNHDIVSMDLPPFYQFRECLLDCALEEDIPKVVEEELVRPWQLPCGTDIVVPEGWSNDWQNFKNRNKWFIPCLRWGYQDIDLTRYMHKSVPNVLRFFHGILGEPYPILFLENNHDVVIFRVGLQVYWFCDSETGLWERSTMARFRHPQALRELPNILQDIDVATLEYYDDQHRFIYYNWTGDRSPGQMHHYNSACCYDRILQYVAESEELPCLDPDPTKWTEDEWEKLDLKADYEECSSDETD
ncbi:hypothetical protein BD410DRAFT_401770 [Rickenella mellea]|uniref:F-box domain-containing protein n=1 Tax=Rickenella mellea TaxID=50990 RepID=A0A4Y7PXA7_9AGAM|nr:hypothetical protein BD410DRAFT_401770 [Rickenella mellea]